MVEKDAGRTSRAVVLGGGGVTGIAWEVGVLAGLRAAGLDLTQADLVLGTSAGSFVGTALASDYDLEKLFEEQAEDSAAEVATSASAELMESWIAAHVEGNGDARKVGAAFGRIALADPEPVPAAVRRQVVGARLVTTEWPDRLKLTAVDADSGELHVFDSDSGIPLESAVAASGAVPGIWPLEHINGRRWIDGGMVSPANALLAAGYERVLIIAPLAPGYGPIPGAVDDVQTLNAAPGTRALLIAPDDATAEAIGPNIYDPSRRGPAAEAGRRQASEVAAAVVELWN
jgi:NTE family protein